jgi:membrane protein DedA with SNARE-associated domain
MVDWLQSFLGDYGYWAIFLALFINNFGFPVPGTTLLLVAGFLVGNGTLSFWPTAGSAAGGCFLGTNCGYWLGRRYGRHLLEKIPWLRHTHKRIRHMEHFFKRYGSKGVFFARFVALLHPVIGILSGMGKMPGRPFLFYNLAGSAAYAILYTLGGEYFGQRWGLHKIWMLHTALFILLLAIVIYWLIHFWSHSIYTFFGHPFYKKKGRWWWGK